MIVHISPPTCVDDTAAESEWMHSSVRCTCRSGMSCLRKTPEITYPDPIGLSSSKRLAIDRRSTCVPRESRITDLRRRTRKGNAQPTRQSCDGRARPTGLASVDAQAPQLPRPSLSNLPLSCRSYDYPPNSCWPEKNSLPSASVRLCVLCASSVVQVFLPGLRLFVPRVLVAAPPPYPHLCSFVFICGQFTSSVVGRPGGASRFGCGYAAPCFLWLIYVVGGGAIGR